MSTWSTIPPWLYQNTLSDVELQELYVKAAKLKVFQLLARRDAYPRLSREWRELDSAALQAEGFLLEAVQALTRYRQAACKTEPEAAPRLQATIRELPKP